MLDTTFLSGTYGAQCSGVAPQTDEQEDVYCDADEECDEGLSCVDGYCVEVNEDATQPASGSGTAQIVAAQNLSRTADFPSELRRLPPIDRAEIHDDVFDLTPRQTRWQCIDRTTMSH